MQYIAAKYDMIGSRRLTLRDDIQKHFLHVADEINCKFEGVLEAKFIVTHGDEAQALFSISHAQAAFSVFEHLALAMGEVRFRCGIGLGTLSTTIQQSAIGMDGEAWQNAKHAIDYAKKKRQSIHFYGFEPQLQVHLNALSNLLGFLQAGWTKEQRETILLVSEFATQREIAIHLGVSDVAVSKRLTAAGWNHYQDGRASLDLQLEMGLIK